ncbi:hypothetical protein L9G74_17230 [Shewanella sp. C32]|uniref:Uncharacterized protein n=1 Tax=Shewanella electrica TaxID=515560 RepID=A0ABT2FSI5_9GAMM|nr:hypothetical protein [Shewanella electrica]MCH1926563.1 hypothetical protein [Shewanella electrica]MCS4558184.1 hypothetical protein [Shewanella electrica]
MLAVLITFGTQAQESVQFPIPKYFKLQVVADDLVFNGVDMSITGFDTNKSPKDIYQFYQNAWRGEIRESAFGDWIIYSHLKDGLLYTVQFQQLNKLRISGTLAISNLPSVEKTQLKNLGKGFPMSRNTKVANDIKTYDGLRESRHLLLVNKMSMASNMVFYKSTLTGQGWVLQHEESTSSEGGALLFAKESSTLNLAMTNRDGQTFIQAIRIDN